MSGIDINRSEIVMKPMTEKFEAFLSEKFTHETMMKIMNEWQKKEFLTKRFGELNEANEMFKIR
ncbi:hypothetical protein [Bacillus sp. AFS088145]|uniref:hypothetical protein n=1 Tax=Bacillus sp. AFS088145 TaxID=2033514 RepID=UPI000BF5542B|nr:hypothetical protein [Bacillus sp. AFS088145]PFH91399.1 hypothetical protein COI44_01990 [Bacillus sp. AFS088145]